MTDDRYLLSSVSQTMKILDLLADEHILGAAISISGASERLRENKKRYIKELLVAAERIRNVMGF